MKNIYLLLLLIFSYIGFAQNPKTIRVPVTKVKSSEKATKTESLLSKKLKPQQGTTFRLIKSKSDKLGYAHKTYQQYYNGIKVVHGIIKMHEKNGLKETFNGMYFNPDGVQMGANISVSQLKNIAQKYMKSNNVFWLDDQGISQKNAPNSELIIYPNRKKGTLHLAYELGVGTSTPELKMGILYIDAQTGKILHYKNMIFACFEEDSRDKNLNHAHNENAKTFTVLGGIAATVYSGSKTIETTLDTDYILYDQTRANTGQSKNTGSGERNGIITVNFNNHNNLGDNSNGTYISDFTDNDNNWTASEMSANQDQYALDAHWGSSVVYDYWKNKHGRNSYDGADGAIASYVHFDSNYNNAAWISQTNTKGFIIYGDGAGAFTPLTNLDVVSHEIGHGITNANSNLDYELESGALNEGFSDIWAMVIDDYANKTYSTSKNFGLLNDENGGGTSRSMSNPNAYNQPDTYEGNFWYDVSSCTSDGINNDYCGVHTNSGVLAYWFWLISQGDSGTNDNGSSYNITGIGMDKAAAIAYRTESVYLTDTSDYADARDAAIQAAKDLYGNCSSEEEIVTNAWYAVGVGAVYSGQNPSITVDTTNQTVCVDEIATFTAEADFANTMIWQNDASGSWVDLSNDSTYAGVATNTLTITNPAEALDGIRFRLKFSNDCGTTTTTNNRYLYVKTLPDVTSVVPSGAGCTSATDGSLTVNFNEVSSLSNIEFSIDGGASYPYNYADTSSSQTISGLAAGDYNVWVRRGGNDCPREVGTYTVASIPTVTAAVDAIIEANIAEIDGIIQVSFPDEATQTQIKFSVDGGISYAYVFNDNTGTGELTDLAADTYEVWATYGDESCAKRIGNFTVNEMAYTQIPDANFEAALHNLGYDNYLGDDKVPTSLINTVTSLNIRLENITDLTGIEYFAALESLTADNNNLTTVDVSSNTELKELVIYNNANLSSFTVANPSIITRVTLSGCNLSGDYDFSDYIALVNFSVQNNDLTGLNIKNGNNTNFTYFDARGNSNLSCILVDDAVWSTTNWTQNGGATFSSTFCEYTAIPDLNFENALEALGYDDISGDGQVPTALIEVVTSLDVTNQGISDATGIQDFVALESLKLNNNSLTSLDVSNLIHLKTLWAASGNVFNTIDVSNNTALEDFRLRQFTGSTVDLLANTALTRFNCTSCDFSTVDTSSNINLAHLDLWNSNITSLDLSLNTSLETLDVYSTNLTTLDLSNNISLTNLIANDITTLSSLNIQNGSNPSITGFNTTGTPVPCILVDDPAWSAINWTNIDTASYFSLYCGNYTAIPDANFEAALEALGYDDIPGDGQVPTALIEVVTSLDVSNQSISNLTGIEDFKDLIDLNVRDNGLTNLDVSNNANLYTLDFDNNDVDNLVLGTNTTLSEVSGRYNQLTSVDVSVNTGLTNLNLRNNSFSTVDVSNNTNLRTLNLNQTGITSLDVTNNTDLAYLYLSGNGLTSIDFSQNPLLENVNLTNSDLISIDLSNQTVLRIIRLSGNNLTELDLTTNVALTQVECADNDLSIFNFKNGFNQIITDFDASGNANLSCILVDDLNKDYTFWTKDVTTSFSNTYCRYTAIPDANFEAVLEALGYDDISADGQVPTALIEVVTDLNVDSEGILNVTGIEDFTALTSLSCFNNALTTIDLSYNLNLESLMLKENSLTAINVLNNTELISLRISDNNLTTLDVSNNINLSVLRCDTNSLSVLDVSNNTQLVHLDVYNMATLTSLNIDSNTNLQAFKANHSGITAIDFSNNPLLRLVYLHQTPIANVDFSQNLLIEELRLQNTQITGLDLSLQTALTNLNCSQNSLSYLNVKNGNNGVISEFDASENPNLTCILVDDVANDYSTWTKDATASFNDTYCRYTTIPDANFEAELEALGYDDISGDGQVPTALIEVVTNLGVSQKSIADLTGIEDFIALTSLNCRTNNLTSIDLSNNLLLESFIAWENNLTSLDVSGNTALEVLSIHYNNLTSIDVSNNAALRLLQINNNDITTLDVSNNPVLETLKVYGLDLTTLDVSNNPELDQLVAYTTQITAFDFSNNPVLRILEVHNNAITSIDFSNNPLLESLRINQTQIEDLDLSAQTNLTFLRCFQTNLYNLNVQNGNNINVTKFDAWSNPNLTCILVDDAAYSNGNTIWVDNIDSGVTFNDGTYCRYTAIPDTNFETELEALGYDDISGDGQVPTQLIEIVETLDVESKNIADLTGIEDFRALKILDAGYNSLSTVDFTNNTELRQLIIRSNNLTTIDLSANTLLVGFKAENCSLTSLDITNNPDLKVLWLTSNDLTAIDLSNNIAMTSFWGNGNDFVTLDFTNNPALNSFRASSNSLISLNLKNGANTNINGGTNFQLTGNAELACVLVDDVAYSASTWLNIDGNVNFSDTDCDYTLIPDANFEARLEALGYDDASGDGKVPTRLIEVVTNLNVSNQDIPDLTGIADFTALEVLLATNNNLLTSIDVSNNANLLTLSAFNCGLTSLDVTNNTNLQRLIIYGNAITNLDVSSNTQLVELDLLANNLTTLDVTNNVLLQTLFVDDNDISSLDVSNNIALVALTCRNNNNLNYLNVKNGNNTNVTNFVADNNPSLTCIVVDDLNNDYSTWTKDAAAIFSDIDCRYTAVPDTNFEAELEALGYDDISGDGQVPTALIEVVTSLDVRSKSISDVTGIADFTALKTFNCNLNNITALDVSTNVNLEALQCTANPIISLDLAHNTQLVELNCRSTDITSLDLTNNTLLKRLICFDTDIVTLDLSQNLLLEDLYCYNTTLTSLNLSLNTALEIVQIYNNELENLDVKNGNNTNVNNFNASGNPNLSCIRVDDLVNDYTTWTKDATATFTDTFCRYTTIPDANFEAWLDTLGYDDISNDGLVPTALIEAATNLNATNQSIANLTGIEDFVALENLYVGNNLLTTLDLSTNLNLKILDVTDNANLATMNVTNNTALEEVFASNSGLTVVNFSNNTALKILTIFDNNLTALDLSNNVNLESILCQNNDIVGLDLSSNAALTYIDVSNNMLTSLNVKNGNNSNVTVFNALNNSELSCILVDNTSYSTTNWSLGIDGTASFNEISCGISIAAKVYLQGAFINPNTGEENLMRDDLRVGNWIPTTSPYTDGLTCNASVFDTTGTDAIVDWVFVELRDKNNDATVLYTQSGLLQRDGDVVATDGVSALTFDAVNDAYYIAIKHRNHLGIMSSSTVALSSTATAVDFTDTANSITFGSNAQTTISMPTGKWGMWAGDLNGDGMIRFAGPNNDSNSLKDTVINYPTNPTGTAFFPYNSYDNYDLDLNGQIRFAGPSNDSNLLKNNISSYPINTSGTSFYPIFSQLP